MPIGLCDRIHVVDFEGPAPHFTADVEIYREALGEMVDHVLLLQEFYGPSGDMNPGLVGLEDCESLSAQLKTKRMVTEKYLVCHFLRIQQALEEGDLENIYWLPGTENPAAGLTEVRCGMAPSSSIIGIGRIFSGAPSPSDGHRLEGLGGRIRRSGIHPARARAVSAGRRMGHFA